MGIHHFFDLMFITEELANLQFNIPGNGPRIKIAIEFPILFFILLVPFGPQPNQRSNHINKVAKSKSMKSIYDSLAKT